LRPGARIEELDRWGEQSTMADLAGIARRINLLTDANATDTLGAAVQVFDFRFHFRQTLNDRAKLHTQ
jgi:hypothetical protein